MDFRAPSKTSKWVCPNDRQLALRGKLNSGWSMKSYESDHYQPKIQPLTEREQEAIKRVIERAETLERKEQERIGRLVDRLDHMKKHVLGNGTTHCILCGDVFGLFHATGYLCADCKKMVCEKCGVEISHQTPQTKGPLWLCKICSETREMWKKSGAWFFRGMPKFVLPEKKEPPPRKESRPGLEMNNWSKMERPAAAAAPRASSWSRISKLDDSDSSSDEDRPNEPPTYMGWISRRASAAQGRSGSFLRQKSLPREVTLNSPSVNSTMSSNMFFNTSSDSGVGDSERNAMLDATGAKRKQLSGGSSESNLSTTSRKTWSIFSDSSHMLVTQPEGPIGRLPSSYTLHRPFIDFSTGCRYSSRCHRHSWWMKYSDSQLSLLATEDEMMHGLPCCAKGVEIDEMRRQWLSQETDIDTYDSISANNSVYSSSTGNERESEQSAAREYESDDRLSTASSTVFYDEDVETIGSHDSGLGTLEMTFVYNTDRCTLQCTLLRGKDLKGTDKNGLADPFCKLTIIPYFGYPNRLSTKTVRKTTNPEFNETFTFYGVAEVDMAYKFLHILVFDDDSYGKDFLGEAKVPLSKVRTRQNKVLSVFLDKIDSDLYTWAPDFSPKGQIFLSLCYSTHRNALIVVVIRCTNLLPADSNGSCDSFIKLHLRSDPFNKKYNTNVVWKDIHPIFNEVFVFETQLRDLYKQTLVLTVWDKDYRKKHNYLGGLELGWESKGGRLKHWREMQAHPDRTLKHWHRLGDRLITD